MQQTLSGHYRVGADSILLWTIACALVPTLTGIAAAAFDKEILSTDPHATLIRGLTWAVVLCLPLVCVIVQWYALKRFAPRLALWMWAGAAIITAISSAFLPSWIRPAETDFSLALLHWRSSDAASSSIIGSVVLTLAKVVGLAILFAVVTSLAQTLLLGFATRLPWKIFLIAGIAGAGAEAVIAHFPDFLGIRREETLNGLSWDDRLIELTLRACAGASYGIASSFALFRVRVKAETGAGSESRKVRSTLSFAALAVICIPVSIAIIGRDGGRSAAFSVLRAFTIAPAKDISHGEAILQYSHLIETRPGKYPVVQFSPDNRYLTVLDRQMRLMLVEVATGRQLGSLAEALSVGDRYALAWSPDSNAVVLLTKGAEDPVPGTWYTRNRARIRKYSIPARELLGEYLTAPDECHESYAQPSLIYAPDGNSFWTYCDPQGLPQPQSTMAIQLDAASLRPLRRKLYGTESVAGEVRLLGIRDGDVVYLQRRIDNEVEAIRLGRLRDDAVVLRVDNLNETGLTSGLLAQGETLEDGAIVAEFCGKPAVKPVADRKSVCRTLEVDATTGKITRVPDDPDWRFEPYRQVVSTRDGLRVEGRQLPTSKKAEILVIEAGTGKVRQRIETREQRPLTFSHDQRWVVTYSPGTERLSVYRITR